MQYLVVGQDVNIFKAMCKGYDLCVLEHAMCSMHILCSMGLEHTR